jgi:cytoskeletal protein CcmA (bactofilin family)
MMATTNGEYPTILGPDAVFKGELQFEKGVKVLGSFEGTIHTKGRLLVAQGAKMRANIEAGDVEIEGDIQGNVTTTNKVQLKSSAKLHGDLRTSRLEVNEGAVFIGQCHVGPTNGKAASPSDASASSDEKPKAAAASSAAPVGGKR